MAQLDSQNITQAVVCGFSMGGYIAFEIYRRHPARVSALGLISTRAEPDTVEGRAGRDVMIALAEREGLEAVADVMVPKLLARGAPTVAVAETRAMILSASIAGVVAALEAMRDRPDSRPLLPHISVPTLVVAGSEDQLIPVSSSRALASLVQGATLELVSGAGHLVPTENAGVFNEVMNRFLARLA